MTFGQLKSSFLRDAMVYITLNCGLLRYDVWTIEKLFFEGCDGVHNSKLWIVEI